MQYLKKKKNSAFVQEIHLLGYMWNLLENMLL